MYGVINEGGTVAHYCAHIDLPEVEFGSPINSLGTALIDDTVHSCVTCSTVSSVSGKRSDFAENFFNRCGWTSSPPVATGRDHSHELYRGDRNGALADRHRNRFTRVPLMVVRRAGPILPKE